MTRTPWTPERIIAQIKRRGHFHTGPAYRDDQPRRVASRMAKAGKLKAERVGYCEYVYTLPDQGEQP
jgi:hypothetical protein